MTVTDLDIMNELPSQIDLSRAIPDYDGPFITPESDEEAKEILEPFGVKRCQLEKLTADDCRMIYRGFNNITPTNEMFSEMNADEILSTCYFTQILKEDPKDVGEKISEDVNFKKMMSWMVSRGMTKSDKILPLRNYWMEEKKHSNKPGEMMERMENLSYDSKRIFIDSLRSPRKYCNTEWDPSTGQKGTDFRINFDQKSFYIDGIIEGLRTYILENKSISK
ncbi:hypothetical protein ACFL6I_23320 [candidate division KSB1 bacterium]